MPPAKSKSPMEIRAPARRPRYRLPMRALSLWLLLLAACAVDRSGLAVGDGGDPERDAAPTPDAGADATPPDLSSDAGPPDAPPPDAGPPDAGGCAPGTIDLDLDPGNGCEYVCTPTGVETCNTLDDDCDGAVDGPGAVGFAAFYLDADGDGYGNPGMSMSACGAPMGHVATGDDCNDADAAVHPGVLEACNGRDEDCDGAIDDGVTCGACVSGSTGGHAYLFCSVGQSYASSETACVGFGYHLATIQDATEDAWVAAQARGMRATGWWIGYNEVGGPYHWIAGTSSYTGWAPGEPSGGSEHCTLEAWTGPTAGSWNDGACGMSFPFVCETPP